MPGSNPLLDLIGRMTIAELAKKVDMSVEALVEMVLSPSPGNGSPSSAAGAATHTRAARPRANANYGKSARLRKPSAKASTMSRSSITRGKTTSLREVHEALDRWMIGALLDEEEGNISRTAVRLGISRKGLRERWARVSHLNLREVKRRFDRTGVDEPPTQQELRALETHAAMREAVDRWLLGGVLEQEQGNITFAARRLSSNRKHVRQRWAHVRH